MIRAMIVLSIVEFDALPSTRLRYVCSSLVVERTSIEISRSQRATGHCLFFIHRGTVSSIATAQITRALPIEPSTEPLACGATFNSKLTGRIIGRRGRHFGASIWNLDLEHDSRDEILQGARRSNGLTRPAERRSIRPLREKYC